MGMSMEQETQVFSCEKCKNEFPSIRSFKKHLKRIHEGKDLALEENCKISIFVNTCVSCENK